MVSRIIKSSIIALATMSVVGVASANANHASDHHATHDAGHHASHHAGYHAGHHAEHQSTLPSISTWSGQTGASYSLNGTSSRYSPSTAFTTMSTIDADNHYGTGSISDSYTLAGSHSLSGSSVTVPGLGHNETLQATSCPVNVHGTSAGANVIGCYNVVKPVPQTTYYRVIRPIIYVRYPVPVATPCATACCEPIINVNRSRYGGFGPQGGFFGGQQGGFGPTCR